MSWPPLYERVEFVLVGDIADGSLPQETQLPSEDGCRFPLRLDPEFPLRTDPA
jgi:hypothetical protein